MEKPAEKPVENDIATEAYKGPGAVVTSLGYSVIEWKIGIAAGLLAGMAAAIAAPQFFIRQSNGLNAWATRLAGHESPLPKYTGKFTHWVVGITKKLADHSPKALLNRMGAERAEATVFAGGFGALTGLVGSLFTSGFHGTKVAKEARHQFERAKTEIKDLRAENASLREKYTELKIAHDTEQPTAPATSDAIVTPAATTPETAPDANDDPARKEPQPQTVIRKSEAELDPARAALPEPALAQPAR